MVTSRTGAPSAPASIRRPVTPTEISPLIDVHPGVQARGALDVQT